MLKRNTIDIRHPYHICKDNFELIEKVFFAFLVLRSRLQNETEPKIN